MKDFDFTSDFDEILAEFGAAEPAASPECPADSSELGSEELLPSSEEENFQEDLSEIYDDEMDAEQLTSEQLPAEEKPRRRRPEPAEEEKPRRRRSESAEEEKPRHRRSEPAAEEKPRHRRSEPAAEEKPRHRRSEPAEEEKSRHRRSEPSEEEKPRLRRSELPAEEKPCRRRPEPSAEEKSGRRMAHAASKPVVTKDNFLETAEEAAKKSISGFKRFVLAFTGLVFGAAAVIVLAWMLFNVHPDSSMASAALTARKRIDSVTRLDAYTNNIKGDLLGDLAVIRKQYKIPEGQLVAPLAPQYNYGATRDPQEVLAVIEEAREYGLLEDQEMIFNPETEFYPDADIEYYCDETILVICWKELIENRLTSCVEVKIADGSQLRRKLAEDTYGSSQYVYATELAAQCNAVAAFNADYYAFRDLGITVYDRRLYRFDEGTYNGTYDKYNATDTLMVNSTGDFLVFHKGEQSTREEMEQFVKDNNIIFAIAFGPVLVEDWTQQWCDWYPIGEVDKEYSRAGIAQYDHLHYLYMTVSFADNPNEYHPRCTINEFAAIMAGKGVRLAYTLDGGQTGEVVFNGKPYNHIDFGTERTVSDIFYFASAIPESER